MKDNFKDSVGYRNPVVPFFGGDIEEDYKNDEYVNVLCALLKENAPELLSRFRYIVIESAKRSEEEKKELDRMEADKFKLLGEIEVQEDKLDYELAQIPKEPGEDRLQTVLTIGLSIFMVVGVAKLFDISATEIFKLDDINSILIFLASVCAAASINIGERKAIESHTKYVFDEERYTSTIAIGETTEKMIDGKTVERSRPAEKKRKLNPAIYIAGAILVCETAFVSLGFLSTIPISTAQPADPMLSSLKTVATIAASALAGLVNIALAWGSALQKASWERENLKSKKKIVDEHFSSESVFVSKRQLNDLEKRIIKKEKEVELARKLSVEEHVRFSQDLADRLRPKHFGVDTPTSTMPTSTYTNGSKRQPQSQTSKR